MKKYTIDYLKIPNLAIVFTRDNSFIATCIELCFGELTNKNFPVHCFYVVEFGKQKFAVEESLQGLKLVSLEKFSYENSKIIRMFYCHCWNDNQKVTRAIERIAYVLRQQGNKQVSEGKYQFGVLSKVPILKWFFKSDVSGKDAAWCSEDCASILKNYGDCNWIVDEHILPLDLMFILNKTIECTEIKDYYVDI